MHPCSRLTLFLCMVRVIGEKAEMRECSIRYALRNIRHSLYSFDRTCFNFPVGIAYMAALLASLRSLPSDDQQAPRRRKKIPRVAVYVSGAAVRPILSALPSTLPSSSYCFPIF